MIFIDDLEFMSSALCDDREKSDEMFYEIENETDQSEGFLATDKKILEYSAELNLPNNAFTYGRSFNVCMKKVINSMELALNLELPPKFRGIRLDTRCNKSWSCLMSNTSRIVKNLKFHYDLRDIQQERSLSLVDLTRRSEQLLFPYLSKF